MGASASRYVTEPSELEGNVYDYVIIGGGPAGCVLASRLSEDPDVKVLLVESGASPEKELFSRIPSGSIKLLKTHADWDRKTLPQKHMENRELGWPAGHLLGGSTNLNAMLYQHAPPDDLNEWVKRGATSWSPEEMARFYRKCEKFSSRKAYEAEALACRGRDGLWETGITRRHPIADLFVKSAQRLGIPFLLDTNTLKGPIGVTHMSTFINPRGERSSVVNSYLTPKVLRRPNLTVSLKARCTKLVLGTPSGSLRCVGAWLQVSEGDRPTTVAASKEVILCAGTVMTPMILMQSGIGDRSKINFTETLVHNPHVGQHLQDHLCTFTVFRAKSSYDYLGKPFWGILALLRWLVFGTGPLASNAFEAAAFFQLAKLPSLWSSPSSKLEKLIDDPILNTTTPDAEIVAVPAAVWKPGVIKLPEGTTALTLCSVALRPLSEGSIIPNPVNRWRPPHIDANYLSNDADLDALVRLVRSGLRIARAAPVVDQLILKDQDPSHKNTDINDVFWLGDQDPDKLTDEELKKWLRLHAETSGHPVSTARIGKSAEDGVVDHHLKVFGVDGLRIADASVFPTQIAGHPTATIIAMGEKLAEHLRAAA